MLLHDGLDHQVALTEPRKLDVNSLLSSADHEAFEDARERGTDCTDSASVLNLSCNGGAISDSRRKVSD